MRLDHQEAKIKAVEGHSPLESKGLSFGGGCPLVSPESLTQMRFPET